MTDLRRTLQFLRILKGAGVQGVPAEDVARVFGVIDPRGMGGKVIKIKRLIEETGVDPILAFNSRRLTKVSYRWFAGPRCYEAETGIQKLIWLEEPSAARAAEGP